MIGEQTARIAGGVLYSCGKTALSATIRTAGTTARFVSTATGYATLMLQEYSAMLHAAADGIRDQDETQDQNSSVYCGSCGGKVYSGGRVQTTRFDGFVN